jgi:hypothetical protein
MGEFCPIGFTSSEDGIAFVTRLEQLPTIILGKAPAGRAVNPSQVDHILAVIGRDKKATVYVNELRPLMAMVINRPITPGDPVGKDDIADISSVVFDGLTIPDDAGILFLFSIGWRKGLYHDFLPISPLVDSRRTYDLASALGQYYTYVLFQERFRIEPEQWDVLFRTKWFPFVGLRNETIRLMLTHIREGWEIDSLTGDIANEIKDKLDGFVQGWQAHPSFANHMKLLERAAERFKGGDYVSAASILFPRIEGLMRSYHASIDANVRPSQKSLPASAVHAKASQTVSLLMPKRFEQYLEEVYFADFKPEDKRFGISRNTVSHGVASEDEFNEKAATIGILVVQQLFFFFERPTREAPDVAAKA